jgi:hypothetical protein
MDKTPDETTPVAETETDAERDDEGRESKAFMAAMREGADALRVSHPDATEEELLAMAMKDDSE